MDWRRELARQAREEPMTRAYRLGRTLIPGSPIQFEATEEVPALESSAVIQGLADLIRQHPTSFASKSVFTFAVAVMKVRRSGRVS